MGKTTINENLCKGCGLCIENCPKQIIAFDKERLNIKGFHPAHVIDQEKCIACAICAKMCPDCAIRVEK